MRVAKLRATLDESAGQRGNLVEYDSLTRWRAAVVAKLKAQLKKVNIDNMSLAVKLTADEKFYIGLRELCTARKARIHMVVLPERIFIQCFRAFEAFFY